MLINICVRRKLANSSSCSGSWAAAKKESTWVDPGFPRGLREDSSRKHGAETDREPTFENPDLAPGPGITPEILAHTGFHPGIHTGLHPEVFRGDRVLSFLTAAQEPEHDEELTSLSGASSPLTKVGNLL